MSLPHPEWSFISELQLGQLGIAGDLEGQKGNDAGCFYTLLSNVQTTASSRMQSIAPFSKSLWR